MQFDRLKRREFISLIGGAVAAPALLLPRAAHSHQEGLLRRIGVLMHLAADDHEGQARLAAFMQGLEQSGWTAGRNVQIDFRWGANDAERRNYAAELVALDPDVILASTSLAMVELQHATRTVPVVFTNVADPVGGGFVASLAHPGGNVTGFAHFEYSLSAKWLELLRDIAPRMKRVGIIRDPANPAGIGQFAVIQSAAASIRMEVNPIVASDAGGIERGIMGFARSEDDGLIVLASALGERHSNLIVELAARHRLPAVYPFRFFATGGGLISYGPDTIDSYRLAAGYVDRILKGAKPADLPVQAPTRYQMIVNLRTAKALGIELRPALLALADEVID